MLEEPAPRTDRLRNSTLLRLAVAALLVLFLCIPLSLIEGLVTERQARSQGVATEVAQLWGGAQTIVGPILSIPYETTDHRTGVVQVLPDRLAVDGRLEPELRRRGIFETVVWSGSLTFDGELPAIAPERFSLEPGALAWERATIAVGITDPRGLVRATPLHWGERQIPFEAGSIGLLPGSGIHAATPIASPDRPIAFHAEIELRGTGSIRIAPSGREVHATLRSPWPHPSFQGTYLPGERRLGSDGFEAEWQISELSRAVPSAWTTSVRPTEIPQVGELAASAFGVDLVQPVDVYSQTLRSVKYGLLFIVMTFTAFFLFEVLGAPETVHPFQYLLVGCALVLFYLLLLSLAEHLPFGVAFFVASAAVVAMVTTYARTVLAGGRWALGTGLLLATLQLHLWITLEAEQYALLLGSFGLFVLLALVMAATRNVRWWDLDQRGRRAEPIEGEPGTAGA